MPTECIARSGIAVVEILALSEEREVDLVVMGVTGGGMLSELMVGSHAASTFRKSKVPVLVVPREAAGTYLRVWAVSYVSGCSKAPLFLASGAFFLPG